MVVPTITAAQARNNGLFRGSNSSGNIPGQTEGLGSDSSSQKSLNSRGTFSGGGGSTLSYPDNIGGADQAHFVIFSIRKFTPAKIDVLRKERGEITRQLQSLSGPAADFGGGAASLFAKRKAIDAQIDGAGRAGGSGHVSAVGGSIRLKEAAKVKIDTRIALYMPPSVSANYSVNYSDQTIGLAAEAGFAAFQAFMRTGGSVESKLTAGVDAGSKGIKDMGVKASVGMLDTIAPGAKALLQATTGTAITPRMELMFESVARRTFSYSFVFIPKSKKEAQSVENIVFKFKEAMHPEFKGGNTFRTHEIPDTVDITYMSGSGPNGFLNKISTCHITGMEVSYGGDRYVAYEQTSSRMGSGNPPQRTSVTLNFSELGILTKQDIRQGF